jgi:chitodextrinase
VTATDPSGSGETVQETYSFTTVEADNESPQISVPIPDDGATGISLTLSTLTITIEDAENDDIDWTITTSPDIGSSSGTSESGGTKTCSISGLDYSTTYSWIVTATDPSGSGETVQETYSFTTVDNESPLISVPIPGDGDTGVLLTTSILSVNITDLENDSFNWSIETSPNIGSNSSSGAYNGTKQCNISGLEYATTYTWFVNATDPNGSGRTTRAVYTFTTELFPNNPPYEPSNPGPSHGESNVFLLATFNWTGGDPDPDDTVTYDIYLSTSSPPEKIKSNHTSNEYTPSKLNPNTKYYWRIVAWDNHKASTSGPVWNFTTQMENLPPTVNIVKPERAFYLFNELIVPRILRSALIIGDITILVEATDPDDGIQRVEFFIDNKLMNTSYAPNQDGLYSYTWTRDRFRFVHMRRIKISAYDNLGQEVIERIIVKRIL